MKKELLITLMIATLTYGCGTSFYTQTSNNQHILTNYSNPRRIIETREIINTPRKNKNKIEKITHHNLTSLSKEKPNNSETILPVNMYGKINPAKNYKYGKEKCAAYAVTVARQEYGKNIKYADAWDISYNNKTVSTIKNDSHLKELIKNKILQPGMIVTAYYPFSKYLNGKDKNNNKRRYTHLVVFAGTDNTGQPTFYHQFKDKTERISLKKLNKKCPTLIEIIDEK